jgi:hypothetical protein
MDAGRRGIAVIGSYGWLLRRLVTKQVNGGGLFDVETGTGSFVSIALGVDLEDFADIGLAVPFFIPVSPGYSVGNSRREPIPLAEGPVRTAELARVLASVLFSRSRCEIEKSSDRASLRQVQLRE